MCVPEPHTIVPAHGQQFTAAAAAAGGGAHTEPSHLVRMSPATETRIGEGCENRVKIKLVRVKTGLRSGEVGD